MTRSQRALLLRRLESLSAALAARESRRAAPSRATHAEVTDEDAAALGEMLQAIASNRNRNDAQLSARVQHALRKAREATDELGSCEECDEEIPFARLEKMPYAELCVECQSKRDPQRGTKRRSVTDYRE